MKQSSSNIPDQPLIVQVAIPAPFEHGLDYILPKTLLRKNNLSSALTQPKILIGLRVKVPLGARTIVGVIISQKQTKLPQTFILKKIINIIDDSPIFPDNMQQLFQWASTYYHTPLGIIYKTAWPTKLAKGEIYKSTKQKIISQNIINNPSELNLSSEQTNAINGITKQLDKFSAHMLHGVTGSGKTEVYLHIMQHVLLKNQAILVLIPEINLTQQMQNRFTDRFSVPVKILHSKITPAQTLKIWEGITDPPAQIILGTRSSVFIPANIGLIIIDECHDASYQQQSELRYCTIKIALMRAKISNIPIVLGSATPSLEILYNIKLNKYHYWQLNKRVQAIHNLKYNLIDLRNTKHTHGISEILITAITKHLNNNGQIFIFINRRGFSQLLLCNQCGWSPECNHCSCRLIYHKQPPSLQCHHCGKSEPIKLEKSSCPKCQADHEHITPVGSGTQRTEQTIVERFPDAKIARIDANTTTKKDDFNKFLNKIHSGEINIIIGTQMLAKGHHFPNLTLVAMVNIDDALFSQDFRATERLGQLLIQVAGRAGRANKAGEVYIQTKQPDNPLLQILLQQQWSKFSHTLMQQRQESALPPFSFEAIWRAEGKQQDKINSHLLEIKNIITQVLPDNTMCLGPAPAILSKKSGLYQYQLLLRSDCRNKLHAILNYHKSKQTKTTGVKTYLEIDPVIA